MKIIFLDIDGVLNWVGTEDRIDGLMGLCPVRIERLNRILEAHPDAKIVVSSSWRKCFTPSCPNFEALKRLLADRGVQGEIIDHTPIWFAERPRGHEIRAWLDQQPPNAVESFVVLDDTHSGMAPAGDIILDLRFHHVATTWGGDSQGLEGGLQDRHIDQAVQVLNGDLLKVDGI